MSTVVFLHAHPDDEASQSAGTIARAARAGHRVVVCYGTDGLHGEVPVDLDPGETLVERRRAEAEASARVTGAQRVAWLGYHDSGMRGWAQNTADGAFAGADIGEAAARLACLLDEEDADVLVGYDWHGGYGHPDHVQTHRVARAAVGRALRPPRLVETTMNRDQLRRQMALLPEEARWDVDGPADDGNPVGSPESEIRWRCDVRDLLDVKRAALACHASQATDTGGFLSMPIEMFREGFGYEWYIDPERPHGPLEDGWFLD